MDPLRTPEFRFKTTTRSGLLGISAFTLKCRAGLIGVGPMVGRDEPRSTTSRNLLKGLCFVFSEPLSSEKVIGFGTFFLLGQPCR